MPLQSRTARATNQRHTRPRRAFTLLELVVAAALGAILLLGLQSAVMIASKAIPTQTQSSDSAALSAALDRLALDLSYAKIITTRTSTGIAFTVADRDADGADDTITYRWSGTPGDSLMRQFNGGPGEPILADVQSLSLTLQTEVVTGVVTYNDSNETLLSSYTATTNNTTYQIIGDRWAAQPTPITIPADAVDYRITRAQLKLERDGSADAAATVQLRLFRGGQPTSRVIGAATIAETSLPGGATWTSMALPSTRLLQPNEPIGLVVWTTGTNGACKITYRSSGAAAGAGAWLESRNMGGSWSSSAGAVMLYELWGVYRTANPAPSLTRATLLQAGVAAGSSAKVEITLPLPNRPEVSS